MSQDTLYATGAQSMDQLSDTRLRCSFYPLGRGCEANKARGSACNTKLLGAGESRCHFQTPATPTLEHPLVTKSGILPSASVSVLVALNLKRIKIPRPMDLECWLWFFCVCVCS